MSADIIKVERPGAGDDTRKGGPPYVRNRDALVPTLRKLTGRQSVRP